MKSRTGQLIVGVALAVLLLAAVLYGVDWHALGRSLRDAKPVPLFGVVVVTVASYWVRAWRWGELLAPLARVGQRDLFSATVLGFASSLIVPRSGELLRPWLISRRHPLPMSAGFATIVLERLVDLITVLVLFGLYLFVLPRPAQEADNRLTDAVTLAGAAAALVAVVLLAFLMALHSNAEKVVSVIDGLLKHAPRWLAEPIGRLLHNFSGGLAVLRSPMSHLAWIGVQSLVLWLLVALGFHWVQVAFAIDLPFQTALLLIAFVVVGESIPTPGLVGGFHAFYVLALTEVYGVGHSTAVAASIAAHALTNLPVLLLGLRFLGREGLSLTRLRQVEEAVPTPPR